MHIDNITNKINGELQNYVRNGLKLYICKDDNYNVYMFTIVLDEIMLNNHWENIQNKVALDFQTKIKKEIIYAKTRGVKTNLTLNTLIKNDEFDYAFN